MNLTKKSLTLRSAGFAAAVLCTTLANTGSGGENENMKPRPGGAFNLRIVSDSVPDWSSRENFVRSVLSGWTTDQEKAVAQFRWSYRCRRVGSPVREQGRTVLDPILFFNSYGVTFCSTISSMNCSLWEAWGRPGRLISLDNHVVAEVHYDGAWHVFDNDFCNYFLNEKGAVASSAELVASRVHGNVADLKPGEFYIFDHCPVAVTPRARINDGPSSKFLTEIAEWYPDTGIVRPRADFNGAHAGHRYVLGLRPNEAYTRHWRPLGTGDAYARLMKNGKDPSEEGGQLLRNSRSNGEWAWKPDLSDPAVLFASENAECGREGLTAKDPAKPASAVLRVAAANVITSAELTAETRGEIAFWASGNGGLGWERVALKGEAPGRVFAALGGTVGGRLEYLLKAELKPGAALRALELRTITQVNPRALPALRLGRNETVAISDAHLEPLVLCPRLTGGLHETETVSAKGWQVIQNPGEIEPSLRSTGEAELTLRAETPRDIRRVRMTANATITDLETRLLCTVSFDGGKAWQELGHKAYAGSPHDHRLAFETDRVPPGVREVLLRWSTGGQGNGLSGILAEVACEPAGPFMPYDVTYSWGEWRGGKWTERRHTERVAGAYHRYAINVGGERPPRMNWIRLEPAGKGPTGYSDGEDVGEKSARPAFRLALGRNLAAGCAYEFSRPASAAFPDVGGKVLTDGLIYEASFYKLQNVNLTGEKNHKRVGELVAWEPPGEVAVTVDLGRAQAVGGARIAAVQPNAAVLFPAKMTVETSADGKEFAPAGGTGWEECFFPPGDKYVWEGADSPVYDALPAGGRLSHEFPVLFEKAREARYVRFRLTPSAGEAGPAAMGLWELEVFDRIEKLPWDERLRLPDPPARGKEREAGR
jgi:hypothetical protein